MKKNTKKMSDKKYISVLLVSFVFLHVIGYAFLSSSIKWQKEEMNSQVLWDVSFKNLRVVDGSVDAVESASISETGDSVDYLVDLINDTDYYKFEVDVVNDGVIDAKIDTIVKSSLSLEQLNYFDYEVMYNDGSFVKDNDLLRAGESKTVVVSVKYKDGVNFLELTEELSSIDLSFSINYVQAK